MNDFLELLKKCIDDRMTQEGPILVAIDGNCTAGKTTLAGILEKAYDCNLFHMDDFFLRPEQRTAERYAETGGNVDYERFQEEVLVSLRNGCAFSYRPFNCKTLSLSEPVAVAPRKLNIIEGSYSLHPYFGSPYDLKIFLSISPVLQQQRILERPPFLHQQFFKKWIPMENRYFEAFGIPGKCDLYLRSE